MKYGFVKVAAAAPMLEKLLFSAKKKYDILDGTIYPIRNDFFGSSVTVSLEKAGKMARLTVHNTGSYIPPEDLPHVFERFYRADKSRTAGDSSGLGLAIVQSVAEAMGGSVAAESSREAGTSFTVLLPRENG